MSDIIREYRKIPISRYVWSDKSFQERTGNRCGLYRKNRLHNEVIQ